MREEILGDIALFCRGLDHETRLTAISLLMASWAWQDAHFPDQVQLFREEVLCHLAHPGRSDESASAASF